MIPSKRRNSDRENGDASPKRKCVNGSVHLLEDPAKPLLNQWQGTITKVVQAVVLIQFTHVVNFDTEAAVVSEATGFIVDMTMGLILTNRHVVGPGVFQGVAILDNHEEVPVTPIYRDPVHDYGFLKFNPADIKYLEIEPLQLKPEACRVGTEIRVVGNDGGDKLSILAGFISRLDRNAPDYGAMMYNDFNTEYIQAAASASGGSLGLPVVDFHGDVVALQAGGSTEASTDFFLPLDRPLRALRCIQSQLAITRGDIQVQWLLKPYDECRRLGLTAEAESAARAQFPGRIGLLVAEVILPEGPADGLIKEGDTLLAINGELVLSFVRVDDLLDLLVGLELEFTVQRNGQNLCQKITVGDLHAITPDRYVEVAGALFNNLSYQIARCYYIPVRGVYINHAHGLFALTEKTGWILELVDDRPTPDLDTFIEVMKTIPDQQKVPIRYRHVADINTEMIRVTYIDRHWDLTFRLAVRNDATGLWDFTPLQLLPLPRVPPEPRNAKFLQLNDVPNRELAQITKLMVQVRCYAPIGLDVFPFRKELGFGVVVDAEHGYVVVLRKFVPHDMCLTFVIFAELFEVPAEVVFLHPHLNYAVVKYDPLLVLADVRTPRLATAPLKRGDPTVFVGHNYNHRLVTEEARVLLITTVNIPSNANAPRYRGTNLTSVLVQLKVAYECDLGILADADGTVRALWMVYLGDTNYESHKEVTYKMGLDTTDVLLVVAQLKHQQLPEHVRMLEAELHPLSVILARALGVTQQWIGEYEDGADDQIHLLQVARKAATAADGPSNPLLVGDIILLVNGHLVRLIRDLNAMYTEPVLQFKVMRKKQELELAVPTVDTLGSATRRVVSWLGALLQAPHYGVRELMDLIPSEVYVTKIATASPCHQYGVGSNSFITHVNDVATPTLEQFIAVVTQIPDNTYVKVRAVTFDNVPYALSIKINYHYFPTGEFKKDAAGKWVETEF